MNQNKLKIFKKRKGLYIYPLQWILILEFLLCLIIYLLDQITDLDLKNWIFLAFGLLIMSLIWIEIKNHFTDQKEIGEFSGEIVFLDNLIEVDNQKFKMNEIHKLDFLNASDIQGRHKISYSFEPRLSHGLDNIFILRLKNDSEIRVNFLQTEWQRLKKFEEILIIYHQRGILHWLTLLDILGIQDYKKIQEFKNQMKNYGQQSLL